MTFIRQPNGKPVIVLIDTFCQSCGELASGSMRDGYMHIPCGECMNHELRTMNVAWENAIPLPFSDGTSERSGFLSRRDFRKRFPNEKPPTRKQLLEHWQGIKERIETEQSA